MALWAFGVKSTPMADGGKPNIRRDVRVSWAARREMDRFGDVVERDRRADMRIDVRDGSHDTLIGRLRRLVLSR